MIFSFFRTSTLAYSLILMISVKTNEEVETPAEKKAVEIEKSNDAKTDTKESNLRWYNINMIEPVYLVSIIDRTFTYFYIIIELGVLIITCLLPYKFLDGAQSSIISGIGAFFFTAHYIAKIFSRIPFIPNAIILLLCHLVAIGAIILSCNEKFSNLFLSIGGSYVVTIFICAFFRAVNYFFYLMTFILFFVGFVMLKKINVKVHYGVIKSLVLSFGILVVIDLLTPVKLISSLFTTTTLSFVSLVFAYAVFLISFILIFFYTFFKDQIREKLNINK